MFKFYVINENDKKFLYSIRWYPMLPVNVNWVYLFLVFPICWFRWICQLAMCLQRFGNLSVHSGNDTKFSYELDSNSCIYDIYQWSVEEDYAKL